MGRVGASVAELKVLAEQMRDGSASADWLAWTAVRLRRPLCGVRKNVARRP